MTTAPAMTTTARRLANLRAKLDEHGLDARRAHVRAAGAHEADGGVPFAEGAGEVGAVDVARGLAGDDEDGGHDGGLQAPGAKRHAGLELGAWSLALVISIGARAFPSGWSRRRAWRGRRARR